MKQTVQTLQAMKERGEKIAMLTCYDYTTAKLMDEAGMDMLLVGDSLGNVILGYSDTIDYGRHDPPYRCGFQRCTECYGCSRHAVFVLSDLCL